MTILSGPCCSTEAHGTLGDTLTYRRTGGRDVASVRNVPRQPRTLAQRAARIFMTWLTKQWASIDAADRATWLNFADTPLLSAYHAYVSHNCRQVQQMPAKNDHLHESDAWPSIAYPTTQATTPDVFNANVATGYAGAILHTYGNWNLRDGWVTAYFLKTAAHPFPAFKTIVKMVNAKPEGWAQELITGLPTGLQTLWALPISKTGLPRGAAWELTATVT